VDFPHVRARYKEQQADEQRLLIKPALAKEEKETAKVGEAGKDRMAQPYEASKKTAKVEVAEKDRRVRPLKQIARVQETNKANEATKVEEVEEDVSLDDSTCSIDSLQSSKRKRVENDQALNKAMKVDDDVSIDELLGLIESLPLSKEKEEKEKKQTQTAQPKATRRASTDAALNDAGEALVRRFNRLRNSR
jgi:hypothetical protein